MKYCHIHMQDFKKHFLWSDYLFMYESAPQKKMILTPKKWFWFQIILGQEILIWNDFDLKSFRKWFYPTLRAGSFTLAPIPHSTLTLHFSIINYCVEDNVIQRKWFHSFTLTFIISIKCLTVLFITKSRD